MHTVLIAAPQMGHDPFRLYMKSKYVASLRRAGAAVRWIDPSDPNRAAEQVADCDGLLLPGGADIAPQLYGRTPENACGKPHVQRDAAEPVMLRRAMELGLPVLAICRGMQMLNVCMGGTLLQDISGEQRCRHSNFRTRAVGEHRVIISPQPSRLRAVFDCAELWVNSLHHQAVDHLGEGLALTAVSEDGYPEAIERVDAPFCVGVQWHPEHMSRRDPAQQELFCAFVRACREKRGRDF